MQLEQSRTTKRYLKKRGRLLSTAWRNGVVGQNVLSNEDPLFVKRACERTSCKSFIYKDLNVCL